MAALQTPVVAPSVDVDSAASGIEIGVVGAVVRAGGLPVDVVAGTITVAWQRCVCRWFGNGG